LDNEINQVLELGLCHRGQRGGNKKFSLSAAIGLIGCAFISSGNI